LAGKKEKTRNSIICFVDLYKNFMQLSLLINILAPRKIDGQRTPQHAVSAEESNGNNADVLMGCK